MSISAQHISGELPAVRFEERPPRVLVADDEPALLRSVARLLKTRGMEVLTAPDGAAALDVLAATELDVVLVDLMMPNVGGLELLERVRSSGVSVEVVIMTAFADVETAVTAVRSGAFHFLTKPFRSLDEVVVTVAKAAERRRLVARADQLEKRLEAVGKVGGLIGNAPRMQEVYRLAVGVAQTSSTVLILGESGTGKELTARAIHQHSQRAARAFVPVNCSAIPENLVESELFGHVRGAFTGATNTREGLFEMADKGTLFLDEIGDLPLLAQVKLLRALQEGEIKRVGANETRSVDVRIVAATNVDLRTRIAEGKFREDLYYRLNVIAISLPPLRERVEDIPLLAHHFLAKYASRAARQIERFVPEAMALLQRHPWPGNVRELENAIEHAVAFCGNEVRPEDLPFAPRSSVAHSAPLSTATPTPRSERPSGAVPELSLSAALVDLPYRDAKLQAVNAFDAAYFSALLQRTGGNVSEAARRAGLDRANFRRAAKRAGIRTRDS